MVGKGIRVRKNKPTRLLIVFLLILAAPNSQSQRKTFIFPGGGVKNNNATIGDFCCTGETATIYNSSNVPVGYIYYYGFSGARNIPGNISIATGFSIPFSGIADINNTSQDRVKGSISFSASELYRGSTQSTTAGQLNFTATILNARKYPADPRYYIMGSVKVKIDVSIPVVLHPVPPSGQGSGTEGNDAQGNTSQPTGETPIKKILSNGDVEISYEDGSRKVIFERGGYKLISPDGRESVVLPMTVPAYVPPNLPGEDINRWLTAVSESLLSFIRDQLQNDQVSIDNLLAGEHDLNIYQVINRRFRFIQSLK